MWCLSFFCRYRWISHNAYRLSPFTPPLLCHTLLSRHHCSLRNTHGPLSVRQQSTFFLQPVCSCPRRPPSPICCARSGRGRGRARDGRPRRTRFPCRKKNELSLKHKGDKRETCALQQNNASCTTDFHFTRLSPRGFFLSRRRGLPRTELQHRARGGLVADVVVHRMRQRAGRKILKISTPERPGTMTFTRCRCDGGSVDRSLFGEGRDGWTRRKWRKRWIAFQHENDNTQRRTSSVRFAFREHMPDPAPPPTKIRRNPRAPTGRHGRHDRLEKV